MSIPVLLSNIAVNQKAIEELVLELERVRRQQERQLIELGEILRDGVERDNFPFRLQIPRGLEIRVTDDVFEVEPDLFPKVIQVKRSTDLDQSTLLKLLDENADESHNDK